MRLSWTVALWLLLGLTGLAHAQRAPGAEYRVEPQQYAGVPFVVNVLVVGFDEQPEPALPKLELPGAKVTPVGASSNVSQSLRIINGRRTVDTQVTWVLRYRVEVDRPGQVTLPALKVVQGTKTAQVAPDTLSIASVPTSDDMKLALELPDRPIYVGETVPVKLVWTFAREPRSQTFSIPLLSVPDFTVSAPPVTNARQTLTFSAGAKDLPLQYEIEQLTEGGRRGNRLTATFFVAPRKAGKVEVPASSVVAALMVGRPDFFGDAPTRLYRATDAPRTLDVRPLPETGRPPTFAGAVGEQFAIDVRTSRSVVSLGEPVELAITVKSDQRLDTLALPRLDVEGGLPKDKFTVPPEAPIGTLSDDGKTKTFQVVAQVSGPATEIPALAFSYFDPKKGTYQTIHAAPIAISVKGGTIVGAGDVVAAKPKPGTAPTPGGVEDTSRVDADLALSTGGAASPLRGSLLWLIVGLLYLVPLGVFAFRTYQVRTRSSREEAGEVKQARRRVEELLDRAGTAPARELAGPLAAALRDLARVLGRTVDDGGLLAKLETESFAPTASGQPLSNDLRSDAAGLLRRWLAERRKPGGKSAAVATLLVLLLAPASARADAIADGRAAYQEAMAQSDATARRTAFNRAAALLGEAARTAEDPELLADWGNAALGAGDMATATLAYRRALALDGTSARARHNLAWLRGRQPPQFQPTAHTGATDTLLFFHQWPRSRRLLVGAGAFAIALLLLVPWRGRRSRALSGLATLPFVVWVAMLGSLIFEARATSDAVVMESIVMRAADSAGAPAALSQPLPRGAEVTILEQRDAWTRVRIANGTAGWIPAGAVERVLR